MWITLITHLGQRAHLPFMQKRTRLLFCLNVYLHVRCNPTKRRVWWWLIVHDDARYKVHNLKKKKGAIKPKRQLLRHIWGYFAKRHCWDLASSSVADMTEEVTAAGRSRQSVTSLMPGLRIQQAVGASTPNTQLSQIWVGMGFRRWDSRSDTPIQSLAQVYAIDHAIRHLPIVMLWL